MPDINWHINRLSKMPIGEIVHRINLKCLEKSDKWRYRKTPPSLPERLIAEFTDLVTLSDGLTIPAYQRGPILKLADQFCMDQYNIFGIQYCPDKGIDWHLDPKTRKRWPLLFWGEMDIRDGSTVGGAKFVWEVNRLYSLPLLGLAFYISDDDKYVKKISVLVVSWLKDNPYPFGVNWTSGIELAVRIANLAWALSFCKGYTFTKVQKHNILNFFWLHGRHLHRYPSRYSSNNNHAIAEAFGLFLLGTFFRQFPQANQWQKIGKKTLERECERQILPDGGSYEYSTTYLSFTVDFFLLFQFICKQQNIKYNPVIDHRIANSCEYISTLMDVKGHYPNIGDQDSAVLVNFGLDNHANLKSILNTGSLLFDKANLLQENFPDLKTLVLLGGAEKITSLQPVVSETATNQNKQVSGYSPLKNILFEKSGISVIRGEMAGKKILFVGNATPLGMPPLYAHGHLDALSFYLSINGKELFVDPGTYLYHCGKKWRRYFRSTAAHNTIRINKQDLTKMPGDFMYGKPYNITEHSLIQQTNSVIWRAGHDAYQYPKLQVSLTREMTIESNTGTIRLDDIIVTENKCLVELFFHFHPDCVLNPELFNNGVMIHNQDVDVRMLLDQRLSIAFFKGCADPLYGWFSKSFNQLEECWTLVAHATVSKKTNIQVTLQIL